MISLAWNSPSKQKVLSHVTSFLSDIRYLQEMPKMVLNVWSLSEVELLQFVAHKLCGFDLGLEAGLR